MQMCMTRLRHSPADIQPPSAIPELSPSNTKPTRAPDLFSQAYLLRTISACLGRSALAEAKKPLLTRLARPCHLRGRVQQSQDIADMIQFSKVRTARIVAAIRRRIREAHNNHIRPAFAQPTAGRTQTDTGATKCTAASTFATQQQYSRKAPADTWGTLGDRTERWGNLGGCSLWRGLCLLPARGDAGSTPAESPTPIVTVAITDRPIRQPFLAKHAVK